MSDNSSIEWTDATWNPVTGCTKVSPGCDHCYAETMHERFHGKGSFATVTLAPHRLDVPLKWLKPRRVFVNSMSDLFHEDIPDSYVAKVFGVMAACPQHTFQILTKRHGRMRSLLNRDDFQSDAHSRLIDLVQTMAWEPEFRWPLPNVWLGVSTESQKWANIRIPALLDTPAAVRWISAEPLLRPIDLDRRWVKPPLDEPYYNFQLGRMVEHKPRPRLHWVVVGGESGPGARPMDSDWVTSLRDQCAADQVPFLFKQWGAHDVDGKRVGKGRAGRELDGRTWDGYPVVA